jgi:predicted small secreted protein
MVPAFAVEIRTADHFDFRNRRFAMIQRIIAPLLAALFTISCVGTLAGCNTVAGAGQDIEQGGKAIKDEAKEKR